MNHKVLLADDSLTIQKVIKITLANQPYDITDCSTEDELFHQLHTVEPKLVFLDFNLSEKYTGYELTAKIKSISPTTKVLLLLGTFDTIDDEAMEKSGASDKIVKPFDSNKFIAICKQLIETFADDEEFAYPEEKSEPEDHSFESEDDQWTVSHSTDHKLKESQESSSLDDSFPNLKNPLLKEVSDWGMSVPGVIDGDDDEDQMMDLPPVIGESKPEKIQATNESRAAMFPQKFPETDDLDYPSAEEQKSASKFISIDNFKEDSSEIEFDNLNSVNESDVTKIEEQIRDEVEENLWHADEFEDLKKEVSSKIEEVKNNFQPSKNAFDESLFKPLDDTESIKWEEPENAFKAKESDAFQAESSSFDQEAMKAQMEEMVKKYVKEYMDEMFKKSTEKVAWEVIPDLAENLIRQELSKISSKVIDED